jgi:hypothetical protein
MKINSLIRKLSRQLHEKFHYRAYYPYVLPARMGVKEYILFSNHYVGRTFSNQTHRAGDVKSASILSFSVMERKRPCFSNHLTIHQSHIKDAMFAGLTVDELDRVISFRDRTESCDTALCRAERFYDEEHSRLPPIRPIISKCTNCGREPMTFCYYCGLCDRCCKCK